jgi:hypothetical protein
LAFSDSPVQVQIVHHVVVVVCHVHSI